MGSLYISPHIMCITFLWSRDCIWLLAKETGKILTEIRIYFSLTLKNSRDSQSTNTSMTIRDPASFISLFIRVSEWLLVSWLSPGCKKATEEERKLKFRRAHLLGLFKEDSRFQVFLERDLQKAQFSDFWTLISPLFARTDGKCTFSWSYSASNNKEFLLVRKRGEMCSI